VDLQSHKTRNQLELAFIGPPLDKGPLPLVIYFALSKEESLTLDPFNQPALALHSDKCRVASITLPGHGPNLDPRAAIGVWAEDFEKGGDPLSPFFKQCQKAIDELIEEGIASSVALMGLSRGVYAACQVAALTPNVRTILGFAPLVKLSFAKEFEGISLPSNLDLTSLCDLLCDRTIRFYIGNRDTRVNTAHTFELVSMLADTAYNRRIRSSPIELLIGPSIGYMGHGTPPHIFEEGAAWLKRNL